MSGNLLETIVAAARKAAQVREAQTSIGALEREANRQPRGDAFAGALRRGDSPRIIAECKRRSPSRGILRQAYDPAGHARAYAAAGAAAVSVLTEPTFFDGSPAHLAAVRASVDLPLLRKDFIVTRYQIVEAAALGADATLLIAGALTDSELRALIAEGRSRGLASLVEVHDRRELDRALEAGATIVGVNSRDLRTLAVDPAVHDALVTAIPREVTAVAESGIRTAGDIARLDRAGYHAFLVGERLIGEPDPGAALATLRRAAVEPQAQRT